MENKSKPLEKLTKSKLLWIEMVNACKAANDYIDMGYLLYDTENKKPRSGKFEFVSLIDKEECICLRMSKTSCSIFVNKDKTNIFGKNTLLNEYKAAKKELSKLKLIPVNNFINII